MKNWLIVGIVAVGILIAEWFGAERTTLVISLLVSSFVIFLYSKSVDAALDGHGEKIRTLEIRIFELSELIETLDSELAAHSNEDRGLA